MNKTDIIELVASEMDCSKVQAGKAVEAVIKSLRDGILDDGGVTITGFGRFQHQEAKAPHRSEPVDRRSHDDSRPDGGRFPHRPGLPRDA